MNATAGARAAVATTAATTAVVMGSVLAIRVAWHLRVCCLYR